MAVLLQRVVSSGSSCRQYGWSMSAAITAQLVIDAVLMARLAPVSRIS